LYKKNEEQSCINIAINLKSVVDFLYKKK